MMHGAAELLKAPYDGRTLVFTRNRPSHMLSLKSTDCRKKGIVALYTLSPRLSRALHWCTVTSFALLPDSLCQRSRSVFGLFPYLPPICGVDYPNALL